MGRERDSKRVGAMMKRIDVAPAGLYEITDEELHQMQNVLLAMLQDIAKECEKHDISWSLSGGNVLGCVRNQGFLPWDDDIDLFMTRADYEKLKSIFDEKLSEKYAIEEPGDANYIMQFPKINKKGTVAQSILSNDKAMNCLAIDIFIIENAYDNRLRRALHGLRCTIYLFIISVMRTDRCKENLLQYSSEYEELSRRIRQRLVFAKIFKFRTLENWLRRSEKCFSKIKEGDSKLVVVPGGTKRYFGEIYSREKMCTLKKAMFSGQEVFLMEDTDYYLRHRYGPDYMTPPPAGQEEKHVYIKLDLNQQDGDG